MKLPEETKKINFFFQNFKDGWRRWTGEFYYPEDPEDLETLM